MIYVNERLLLCSELPKYLWRKTGPIGRMALMAGMLFLIFLSRPRRHARNQCPLSLQDASLSIPKNSFDNRKTIGVSLFAVEGKKYVELKWHVERACAEL